MAATEVPAMTGGDEKYGGNIRMSAYADTRDWDPLGSASLSSIQAYSQLYNQLVQFSTGVNTTELVGDLADSWETSNGGSTFTFHINEDAVWNDGVDVTADDVVFALSRYMDPENSMGRSGLFRNYTIPVADGGIKKVDDDTVEMNLSFASGAFINFLALDYAKILPKHILEAGVDLNQAEGIMDSGSGSGPFKLTDYQRGNTYAVVKNENYFKEGLPYFDSIDHFIITDTGTLIAQVKAGQIDMMNGGFSNLSPTEYLEVDADTVGSPNGHVIANEMPGSRNWGLMINRKAEPFTDPRIRKAIYLAVDRAQINDILEDSTGDIPCALWGMGYTLEECSTFPGIRDKDSDGGKADLAYAKQLMADAGFPTGFTTKYDARQVGNYPDVCSVIKQQLSNNLGIEGKISTHESAAGYSLFGTSRPEGAVGDWELACQGEGMTVLDPDALLGGVYLKGATRNYTDWEPAVVRDAFEEQKVEQDAAVRRQQLKDLEDFLIPTNPDDISQGFTDGHWVTLYWGKFFWLVHEDIQGFNPPATVQYSFKHEDLWLDR
jgi:ABC-type transport system substrate-binding protein